MSTLPQLIEEDIGELNAAMQELLIKSEATVCFVIDKGGVVRHREVLDDARNEPDYEKVKKALASL